jgi:superfamily I DNA and/or RNA helicase
VALTRARHGMVIIGNAKTLINDTKWRLLLELLKNDGQYFSNYKAAYNFINDNND